MSKFGAIGVELAACLPSFSYDVVSIVASYAAYGLVTKDERPKFLCAFPLRNCTTAAVYEGLLYVAADNEVSVFTAEGAFKFRFRALDTSFGMVFDSAGLLFMSHLNENSIGVYSAQGKLLRTFGTWGTAPDQVWNPQGLCFDSKGRLYVAGGVNDCVQVFNRTTGRLVHHFGERGAAEGKFSSPVSVVVRRSECIVAEVPNNRIQVFDLDGKLVRKMAGSNVSASSRFARPRCLAVDDRFGSGHVFVANDNNTIVVLNQDGELVTSFGCKGKEAGMFDLPTCVLVDGDGRIFVVDSRNHRIQTFGFDAWESHAQPLKEATRKTISYAAERCIG